jgi:DNA-binding transcriptional regulator YdaS (Cro superfamily)
MILKSFLSGSKRGEAAELAKALGVSPSYLSQLASGNANISPIRAVEIEIATSGAVTRPELRPDDWHLIWPELIPQYPDLIPAEQPVKKAA